MLCCDVACVLLRQNPDGWMGEVRVTERPSHVRPDKCHASSVMRQIVKISKYRCER